VNGDKAADTCNVKPPDCKCKKSFDTCGSEFEAACNRTANTLYTCGADLAASVSGTPCPNGCSVNGDKAADTCKPTPPNCNCTKAFLTCGSSFDPACNRTASVLYTCNAVNAIPVAGPNCTGGCEATVGKDDVCLCVCKNGNKACGSTFPPICKFSNTSLYTCTAAGVTPSDPKNCTAGCELSSPDNRCINPCAQLAKDAAAAIDSVVKVLSDSLSKASADEVAKLDLPPFISLFTELSTNLTKAADDTDALSAMSSSVNKTVNGAFMVLQSALKQNLFQNATRDLLIPANSTLRTQVMSSLTKLISCTGNKTIDCSGLNKLYKSFVNVATPIVAKYTETVSDPREGKTGKVALSVLLPEAVSAIDSAIATRNQTKLDASGLLLNKIIGLASSKKFGPSRETLIFVYDSAGYAAECAGLNVTDWQNFCKTFGRRTSGFLGDFIQMVNNFLGQVPFFGPLVVKPFLDELKELVDDAQTGAATAIGGALSAIEAVLSILSITGVPDNTNPIRDFVLNIVGIRDMPAECGTPDACQGVIMAVKMLINAAATLLNNLGIPVAITDMLKGVINDILRGLNTGSAAIINTAASGLRGVIALATTLLTPIDLAAGLIGVAPLLPKVKQALDTIINGLEAILKCWVTNPKV
ncbi:hypothetical protein BGZ82_001670, partial [Podila clonocystis]